MQILRISGGRKPIELIERDDFSYKHKIEEMNILNWRLGLYFQELFKIENGLNTFEDDSTYNGMKNFVPEEKNVLAILVKAGLHFDYIQVKINNVLEFIERLRNQMKTVQRKVQFESKEIEIRECPKFSLDNPWESIHYSFKYMYEEILSLKYDLKTLLDYLDDDE